PAGTCKSVRHPDENSMAGHPRLCGRAKVPWCCYRHGFGAAHLGPKHEPAPSCPLYCPGRRAYKIGKVEARQKQRKIPFPCKGDEQGIPGKVHGCPKERACHSTPAGKKA